MLLLVLLLILKTLLLVNPKKMHVQARVKSEARAREKSLPNMTIPLNVRWKQISLSGWLSTRKSGGGAIVSTRNVEKSGLPRLMSWG